MSLTSLVALPEAAARIRRHFRKPRFRFMRPLLASPQTENHALVGTAFDYMLRFLVGRLNPTAVSHSWLAEAGSRFLRGENRHAAERWVKEAVRQEAAYRASGQPTGDLFLSCLRLAHLDMVCRSGIIAEFFGIVDARDVEDMRCLTTVVPWDHFRAQEVCVLNPCFGWASERVGGADADILVDDTLIELKTTKEASFSVGNALDQLIGYWALSELAGVDGAPNARIRQIGIYFARHGLLWRTPLSSLATTVEGEAFLSWLRGYLQ